MSSFWGETGREAREKIVATGLTNIHLCMLPNSTQLTPSQIPTIVLFFPQPQPLSACNSCISK